MIARPCTRCHKGERVGQAGLCEPCLLDRRWRNRENYRRKVGIPLNAPLRISGRPREETLIAS